MGRGFIRPLRISWYKCYETYSYIALRPLTHRDKGTELFSKYAVQLNVNTATVSFFPHAAVHGNSLTL